MLTRILLFIVGFIEVLIGLRIALLFLGANPNSQFVHWIYSWSNPFVAPFAGVFGQHPAVTALGQGAAVQSIFDWTAVIAFVFYAIIGAVLSRFTGRRLAPAV